MRSLVRVIAPAVPVVEVGDALAQLGLSAEASARLAPQLAAAEEFFDGPNGYLGGRALVSQQWDMHFDAAAFPDGKIRIPLPPLIKVDELAYEDETGALVALPETAYRAPPGSASVLRLTEGSLADRPSWRLRFTCGYGETGAMVPAPIRAAIVLRASYQQSLARADATLVSETVNGVGSQTWEVSAKSGAAYDQAAANLVSGYRIITV